MPRLAGARRCKGGDAGPSRLLFRAVEPGDDRGERLFNVSRRAADCGLPEERRRGLTEGASMNLLRQRDDGPVRFNLNRRPQPAPAGRRPKLRSAVVAFERARLWQRCRKPQNFGRIER